MEFYLSKKLTKLRILEDFILQVLRERKNKLQC